MTKFLSHRGVMFNYNGGIFVNISIFWLLTVQKDVDFIPRQLVEHSLIYLSYCSLINDKMYDLVSACYFAMQLLKKILTTRITLKSPALALLFFYVNQCLEEFL